MRDETKVREALVRLLLCNEGYGGATSRTREANARKLATALGLRPTALCDSIADALLDNRAAVSAHHAQVVAAVEGAYADFDYVGDDGPYFLRVEILARLAALAPTGGTDV